MEKWGALALMAGVVITTLPALRQQWRDDRAGFIKTLWLLLAYIAVCLLAGGLLIWFAAQYGPSGDDAWKPLELTVALVGLIFYGALPPRWLMRFGVADGTVLAVAFLSLALYFWA